VFTRIPTVLRSQEILDKCFSKASKIEEPYFPNKADKVRKEVIDRISTIEGIACSYFKKLIKKFPTIEKIHPFYEDLVDLLFDVDEYKKSLGKIQWISEKIESLSTYYIKRLKQESEIYHMNKIMKEYYGRVSSLINDASDALLFLGNCRDSMRKIPEVDTEIPTFIVAGMPNVGKSSLIVALTGNEVKVAPYPFTTQSIHIGYLTVNNRKIQLIDTPGILDRPAEERNEMEKKALLALKDIAGSVLFIFDGTGQSGYSYNSQERLFSEISEILRKPIIRLQSKIDIEQEVREDITVSVGMEETLDNLKKILYEKLQRDMPWSIGNQ